MKPTKNRFYCMACNRAKMLFPTKSKADNFIRFNKDDIAISSETVPVRAYYCSFCCGWHVTSKNNPGKSVYYDQKDEYLWQLINSGKKTTKHPNTNQTKNNIL